MKICIVLMPTNNMEVCFNTGKYPAFGTTNIGEKRLLILTEVWQVTLHTLSSTLLYDAAYSSKPCALVPQKPKTIWIINFIGASIFTFAKGRL